MQLDQGRGDEFAKIFEYHRKVSARHRGHSCNQRRCFTIGILLNGKVD